MSAVLFRAALHLSWVDALYFTVTTASTTGYGDINLVYAPWWAKLYGVGFMFAAALSLATLFALAADAVIGARILEALGVPRRGMRKPRGHRRSRQHRLPDCAGAARGWRRGSRG